MYSTLGSFLFLRKRMLYRNLSLHEKLVVLLNALVLAFFKFCDRAENGNVFQLQVRPRVSLHPASALAQLPDHNICICCAYEDALVSTLLTVLYMQKYPLSASYWLHGLRRLVSFVCGTVKTFVSEVQTTTFP